MTSPAFVPEISEVPGFMQFVTLRCPSGNRVDMAQYLRDPLQRMYHPTTWERYPEHDHAAEGEKELHIPLEGSGVLHADGRTYPLQRGAFDWGTVILNGRIAAPAG